MQGVLGDVQTIWTAVNYRDIKFLLDKGYGHRVDISKDHILLNSSGTVFSTTLTKEDILDRVRNEFTFFNKDYFESRSHGFINLFLTGHGGNGNIPCNDEEL